MSGLEALRASIAGELPAPPITRLMGIELVEGRGRTVHVGRTLATAEGEARDGEGRLLATGTASYHLRRG